MGPFAPGERARRLDPRCFGPGLGRLRERAGPSGPRSGSIGGRFRGSNGRGGRLAPCILPLRPGMGRMILRVGPSAPRIRFTKSRVGPTILAEGPSALCVGPTAPGVQLTKSRVGRTALIGGPSALCMGPMDLCMGPTDLCMGRSLSTGINSAVAASYADEKHSRMRSIFYLIQRRQAREPLGRLRAAGAAAQGAPPDQDPRDRDRPEGEADRRQPAFVARFLGRRPRKPIETRAGLPLTGAPPDLPTLAGVS
jgi:hypothetical protein